MKNMLILLAALSIVQVIANTAMNGETTDMAAALYNMPNVESSIPVPIEISPVLKNWPKATEEIEPVPVVVAPGLKEAINNSVTLIKP